MWPAASERRETTTSLEFPELAITKSSPTTMPDTSFRTILFVASVNLTAAAYRAFPPLAFVESEIAEYFEIMHDFPAGIVNVATFVSVVAVTFALIDILPSSLIAL